MWVPVQVMMLNTTITCHTPPVQAPAPASFNPSTPMMVVVAVVIPAVMVATLAVVSPAYRRGLCLCECSMQCVAWKDVLSDPRFREIRVQLWCSA